METEIACGESYSPPVTKRVKINKWFSSVMVNIPPCHGA